jgi:methionine-rich copper-binding protein CopC
MPLASPPSDRRSGGTPGTVHSHDRIAPLKVVPRRVPGVANRGGRASRTPLMPRSRLPRLLLAGAAAVALVLGPVGSAAAHDVLVGTAPGQDAAVETAPAGVTLRFSDAPQSLGTEVVVRGPGGAAVSEGAALVDGSAVRQSLRDGLPAGTYTVDWRATSADGHPLSGTFAFTVTEGASASGQAGAADRGGLAAASSDSSSFPFVRVVVAVIAGGAALLVVRQLRRPA